MDVCFFLFVFVFVLGKKNWSLVERTGTKKMNETQEIWLQTQLKRAHQKMWLLSYLQAVLAGVPDIIIFIIQSSQGNDIPNIYNVHMHF